MVAAVSSKREDRVHLAAALMLTAQTARAGAVAMGNRPAADPPSRLFGALMRRQVQHVAEISPAETTESKPQGDRVRNPEIPEVDENFESQKMSRATYRTAVEHGPAAWTGESTDKADRNAEQRPALVPGEAPAPPLAPGPERRASGAGAAPNRPAEETALATDETQGKPSGPRSIAITDPSGGTQEASGNTAARTKTSRSQAKEAPPSADLAEPPSSQRGSAGPRYGSDALGVSREQSAAGAISPGGTVAGQAVKPCFENRTALPAAKSCFNNGSALPVDPRSTGMKQATGKDLAGSATAPPAQAMRVPGGKAVAGSAGAGSPKTSETPANTAVDQPFAASASVVTGGSSSSRIDTAEGGNTPVTGMHRTGGAATAALIGPTPSGRAAGKESRADIPGRVGPPTTGVQGEMPAAGAETVGRRVRLAGTQESTGAAGPVAPKILTGEPAGIGLQGVPHPDHAMGGAAPPASLSPSPAPAVRAGAAFERMDTAGAPHVIETRPQRLAVGVNNAGLGWVEIRATAGAGGQVSATLASGSAESHSAIAAQLPAVREFLAGEHVHVGTLTSERFPASSSGQNGASGESRQEGGKRQSDAGEVDRPQRALPSEIDAEPLSYISVRV